MSEKSPQGLDQRPLAIALTGASGLAGRFLCAGLAGHTITVLGRRALPGHAHVPWDLTGPAPSLHGVEVLIHAAFAHVPGRYRGGEGDDPDGFLRANLDGTRRLFDAAAQAGTPRVIFLSSRAVFDGLPDAVRLSEDRAPQAHSLYGQVKARAEAHLAALPLTGIALRATGLYGPGPGHKWQGLFADYLAGRPVAPRRGTELHGADLADAARRLLQAEAGVYHASDILLDRHDLLSQVQRLTGCTHPPPPRSDRAVNPLVCQRLPALGWRPGGWDRLCADLPAMLDRTGPRGTGA